MTVIKSQFNDAALDAWADCIGHLIQLAKQRKATAASSVSQAGIATAASVPLSEAEQQLDSSPIQKGVQME